MRSRVLLAIAACIFSSAVYADPVRVGYSAGMEFGLGGADSTTMFSQSLHGVVGPSWSGVLVGPYFDVRNEIELGGYGGSYQISSLSALAKLAGAGVAFRLDRYYLLGAVALIGGYDFHKPKDQTAGFGTVDPKDAQFGFRSPLGFRAEAGYEFVSNLFLTASFVATRYIQYRVSPPSSGPAIITATKSPIFTTYAFAFGIGVHY